MFIMNIMFSGTKISDLVVIPQDGQVVPSVLVAPLVVEVHQVRACQYTWRRRERTPRGRSYFSRHSALSPLARESDPARRGSTEDFPNSLMAEDGIHRVSPPLVAYTAVSTPNGLHLPYQKADAVRRHRLKKGGDGGQVRTGAWPISGKLPFQLGYPVSARLLLVMIAPVFQKSIGQATKESTTAVATKAFCQVSKKELPRKWCTWLTHFLSNFETKMKRNTTSVHDVLNFSIQLLG
jgi:hypothetical protein